MFYAVTSKEYTYEALAQITVSKQQLRQYKKKQFDIQRYAELKQRQQELKRRIEDLKEEYKGQDVVDLLRGAWKAVNGWDQNWGP